MPTIAQMIVDASLIYLAVGSEGLVLRCRRPSDDDIRALGGDVLRGAVIGAQALAEAASAHDREWSTMTPEEQERRVLGRQRAQWDAMSARLEQDPEYRARADGLWRARICAAVEAAAVVEGVAAVGDMGVSCVGAPAGATWQPLSLVPRRELADPDSGSMFVCDLFSSVAARLTVQMILTAIEATPPLVTSFRPIPGVALDPGLSSEALRSDAA